MTSEASSVLYFGTFTWMMRRMVTSAMSSKIALAQLDRSTTGSPSKPRENTSTTAAQRKSVSELAGRGQPLSTFIEP